MNRQTRRSFLRLGIGSGLAGLTGCQNLRDSDSTRDERTTEPNQRETTVLTDGEDTTGVDTVDDTAAPVAVRGALYIPARAWTTYQMWKGYDRAVIERDFGYAARVNLNAIRTWLNYEYWRENRAACERRLEHLLSTAEDNGLRVLLTLFEGVGEDATKENLTDTNPLTATTTVSPSAAIVRNRRRWGEPRQYLRWVLERWRDDDRLLGFEIMNEPGWSSARTRFSRAMFRVLRRHRGSVPLTVGSTSIVNDLDYASWGSDILQFHYNFPTSEAVFRDALRQVAIIRERVDQPVWLTEWQRVRSGRGFHAEPDPDERGPNYASMAPIIQDYEFGNFFWSLMVKPAVVTTQRRNGIINGLFHEDGAVWSLEDARAIKAMSGDSSFDGRQRQEWPDWAAVIKEKSSGGAG